MKNKLFWFENIRKHTLEKLIALCKKEKLATYSSFIEKYPSEYQQAFQQGWTPQIKEYFKQKMMKEMPSDEELANSLIKKELLINNARLQSYFKLIPEKRIAVFSFINKYKTSKKLERKAERERKRKIKEELRKSKGVKIVVVKNGKSKIIFKKHRIQVKHNIRYTEDEIYTIAKKYVTRKEFGLKDKGAYEAAIRRKIIDRVCAHMIAPYESLGEQLVRKAFNYHFGKIFYKLKPDWLVNPKTGKRLELDGFNDDLQIAFEVQGFHHYQSVHQDIGIIQAKDHFKVLTCENKKVKLYVFRYNSLEQLELDLHKEFGISRKWLMKVSFDLQEKLSHSEIMQFRKLLKLTNEHVEFMDYEVVAKMINALRKQNLTNLKIRQVLELSKSQFTHRIYRINQKGIPLIHR